MPGFTIGQKISSIIALILGLMCAAAAYSVAKTAAISEDLEVVVAHQMPLSEAVSRINVDVLEHGVVLQRLFVMASENNAAAAEEQSALQQSESLNEDVNREFTQAKIRLDGVLEDPTRSEVAKETAGRLKDDLGSIEQAYRRFERHANQLLEAREAGDFSGFEGWLVKLNARQDAIYQAINQLRGSVAAHTGQAVIRADRDERQLLTMNVILTGLAAVLGFLFAITISRGLVASVKRLVAGTELVEAGDLDAEVAVTTRDEVGRLTGSFNQMIGGLRVKERIKDTFGKYMDPRVVSNLLDHPEFAEPGGERREMTVMFIDLKGFTSISEQLPPDQLVKTVNAFFGQMTRAVSDHGGVIDKFMGDAVMAYWGPPFCDKDSHAAKACEAALDAVRRLEIFRDQVRAELGAGAETLDIDLRVGISTGEMIVGTIGSAQSRSFTVMGDPVNLGSRLEGANKTYGTRIMISDRTREAAGQAISVRELDLIRVKGKAEPTRVFELLDPKQAVKEEVAQGQALAAYRAQDWERAERHFRSLQDSSKDDFVPALYLNRIEQLKQTPPPSDWDGVWIFETK